MTAKVKLSNSTAIKSLFVFAIVSTSTGSRESIFHPYGYMLSVGQEIHEVDGRISRVLPSS